MRHKTDDKSVNLQLVTVLVPVVSSYALLLLRALAQSLTGKTEAMTSNQVVKPIKHYLHSATILSLLVIAVGCSSDRSTPTPVNNTPQVNTTIDSPAADASDNTAAAQEVGTYTMSISNDNVTLVEGNSVSFNVQVRRSAGYDGQVTLALEDQSSDNLGELSWAFSNTQLQANQNSATVTVSLDYNVLPIQRQTRTLRVLGTDGRAQNVSLLNINIEPTNLPDVYLLVGQSNMVGASEVGAKQAFPGGADEVHPRIFQLNVTGNDGENFTSPASFTDVDSIAVSGQRITQALDPLHDGFDNAINGKSGDRIGMGLSFAKEAVANTQGSIYLVPAAWSDSGFCRREGPLFPDQLGWNATPNPNPSFAGTLLHDRAIARANLALSETGGILRGILWHQGEADTNDAACAAQYQQNMLNLVNSLRTNIQQDARGSFARGANANIPFVVGTMSQGEEYIDLWDEKIVVDAVHRNIGSVVPFADFVNSDDLVPPTHGCGDGDCIHFGSTSYREMGVRYYNALINAATQP